MQKIYSIILAGGSGTRLWPISRKLYPKQFVQLEEFGGISLFQKAFLRAAKVSSKENILIITNSLYKFHCITQINELGFNIDESQILIEPKAKGTLSAITFGVKNIAKDSDVALVLSSDHIIGDEEYFAGIVNSCLETAKDHIITFGIKPVGPNTGYGYISVSKSKNFPAKVQEFKEKPDQKTAIKYIKNGYFWNGGMFMFSKKIFFDELKKNNKEYYDIFKKEDNTQDFFDKIPNISIDYGLMEKTNNIYLMPINTYWNDLGSFDAIDDYLKQKGYNNFSIIQIESKNNFILAETKNKKITVLGLDDCIIVDTRDALLISKKGETQKIKQIVDRLAEEKSYLTDFGMTVYRPWGSYTILDKGDGYKTKRLSVLPGKRLSLQIHHHRSEHWTIVSGTATVTIDDKEKIFKKGESTFIPIGAKHRLANNGKVDLHVIESQIGDYLEEDDTVSFADDFGRGQKRVGS